MGVVHGVAIGELLEERRELSFGGLDISEHDTVGEYLFRQGIVQEGRSREFGGHLVEGVGHGFGVGPAVGRLSADLIRGVTPIVDPSPFRYERMIDGTDLGAMGMM